MAKALSIFALALSMVIAGCASIIGQPRSGYDDVCSAEAPESIIGKWTVVGLNGRQLPDYFPQSSLWVSKDNISASSAHTGASFTTNPSFHAGDGSEAYERAGSCYTLENGQLDVHCPSVGVVPAKRYGRHQRSIYRTQDKISAVWGNDPLILGRLGDRLCATNSDGKTLEYILAEE